jgi:hypothetical protein
MPFDIIYDLETYKNVFTLSAVHAVYDIQWQFEISDYRNDSRQIIEWCQWIAEQGGRMVGFNNVGFDYPVLHMLIAMGKGDAATLYEKAMQIIQTEEKFAHLVFPSNRYVDQLDLYKIHHFDNKARTTSLKALEFNMRMDNISDLPFPVGTMLNREQIKALHEYNMHDVRATKLFYEASLEQIRFREELVPTLGEDVMNANDVKIGTLIFQKELEKAGVQCYEYGSNGRQPKQTPRDRLVLRDAILPWIELETPGFKRILDHLRSQVIRETKGVFDGLVAHEYGLDFVFGTGGIHAAVENESFIARGDMLIESRDVSSYYPNLAITNRFYPEHLGEKFCDIYQDLYHRRKGFPKGTAMNAAYKLALNGTYGKAGDKFSVFYDLLFLLKITLNGQLLLCLLAENLAKIPTLRLIMLNTDGLEYTIHPDYVGQANKVCEWWQQLTKLELESARYSKLFILNVNNYLGEMV